MIQISCRTNIDDLHQGWPEYLPEIPKVGDLIQNSTEYLHGIVIELRVVSVTWKFIRQKGTWVGSLPREGWFPSIELHMPEHQYHNFSHFRAVLDYALGRIDQETLQQKTQELLSKDSI